MDRLTTLVVACLAALTALCLGGVIYLAAHQLPVPDVLVATTGACIGSLGSILVARRDTPT